MTVRTILALRTIWLSLIAMAVLMLLAWLCFVWYCRTHPDWRFCKKEKESAKCRNVESGDICIPTVEEPSSTGATESDAGFIPRRPASQGDEISMPSGPGSFDVAGGVLAVADPVHLRVLLEEVRNVRDGREISWQKTLKTSFPPVRVHLRGKYLLIQEYEGPSDNDVIAKEEKQLLGQVAGWQGDWYKDWPGHKTAGFWCWIWYLLKNRFGGWLITILAVSLGAPFWFDTLSRFMNVRSSGKPPDQSSVKASA